MTYSSSLKFLNGQGNAESEQACSCTLALSFCRMGLDRGKNQKLTNPVSFSPPSPCQSSSGIPETGEEPYEREACLKLRLWLAYLLPFLILSWERSAFNTTQRQLQAANSELQSSSMTTCITYIVYTFFNQDYWRIEVCAEIGFLPSFAFAANRRFILTLRALSVQLIFLP